MSFTNFLFISTTTILFIICQNVVDCFRNNVCSDYVSYLYADYSANCFYTRDNKAEMNDRLIFYMRRTETHRVVTADGYILNMYRLRHPRPRGVVVLQHPLTVDSRVWMIQRNESTALLFWRRGYDVWMPNYRGTYYSARHMTLTNSQLEYWRFSNHEMGYYDEKAIIDYVYEKCGRRQVIYVGHSLSTTAALIYASLRPQEALEKVKVMVMLATVGYMKYMETPPVGLAVIEPFGTSVVNLIRMLVPFGYSTDSAILDYSKESINKTPFKFLIPIMSSIASGFNPMEFDPSLVNMFATALTPTSLQTYQHFAHILRTPEKKSQMFDYGKKKNMELYNQTTPPLYPVQNIKTPMFLISGERDTVAAQKDITDLLKDLSPEAKVYGQVVVPKYNHFDFHVGKNRIKYIWNPVLDFLDGLQ